MMTFIAAKKIKQTSEPIVAPVTLPIPAPVAKPKRAPVKPVAVVVAPSEDDDDDSVDEMSFEDDDEELTDEGGNEVEEVEEDDSFELKTGGVFAKEEILKIELPKFMIKNDLKNLHVVEDKSTVILTIGSNESNTSIGKRVFGAIKNGFREFKIEFHDMHGDVGSVWEFKGARLRTVDFGALEAHGREEPRTIMCEVEYDDLVIDKESFV